MRLLITGAGATGGYIGGRLAEAGQRATFLLRAKQAAEIAANGLRIESPRGNAHLSPDVITAESITGPYDVVLLTVKSYQLEASLDDLAPAIGPDTMILPVLNGMRHMDRLAKRFSPANVAGCALKLATTLSTDGRIIQLSPLQDFAYGELDGRRSNRILALDAFMQPANIGARISTDIYREMWEKWVLLASLGAVNCLARGTVGDVVACEGGADFILALMAEIVSIIQAIGRPPSDAFLAAAKQQLTEEKSPLASSMYRDLMQKRTVEVEAIIGDLVRAARTVGLATPILSSAYLNLRVYQNQLDDAASPR
jgi:2-dehydropantoate 2-reductase